MPVPISPEELWNAAFHPDTIVEGYVTEHGTRIYEYRLPNNLSIWLLYSQREDEIAAVIRGLINIRRFVDEDGVLFIDPRARYTPAIEILKSDLCIAKSKVIKFKDGNRYLGVVISSGYDLDVDSPGMLNVLIELVAVIACSKERTASDMVLDSVFRDLLLIQHEALEEECMMYR